MRELQSSVRQSGAGYSDYVEGEIFRAKQILFVGDHKQALSIWHLLYRTYPTPIIKSKAALELLLDLGAFEDAELMMQAGVVLFPNQAHLLWGHAEIARRRGDLQEALRRCEIVRRRFPYAAEGYTIASACLNALQRGEEAETLISQILRKFPDRFELIAEHASCAIMRKDWETGLVRWQSAKSYGHDFPQVLLNIIGCLRELGRYPEAETLIEEVRERFPRDSWVFVEAARVASAKGDTDEALRYWSIVRKREPFVPLGYSEGAAVARQVGDMDLADAILREGTVFLKSDLTSI